jgi:hypothetical protein
LWSCRSQHETEETQERIVDAVAVVDLSKALPKGVTLLKMAVTEWQANSASYFVDDYPVTLVFFDRDLKAYGGANGGDRLLTELHSLNLPNVHFGLFTHEANLPEREMEIADELHDQIHAAVSVMGKERVDDLTRFAEGLRVFLYTKDLNEVRTQMAAAVADSATATVGFIEKLSYQALMSAVEAARNEGTFEPDGPLRMAKGVFRRELETRMRAASDSVPFSRVRAVAKLKISARLPQSASMSDLEWSDRFDEADYLSESHLPLEVGDLFEATDESGERTYFILLVQSCDLIVRKEGGRTNSPDNFTLAKVVPCPDTGGKPLGSKYFKVGKLIATGQAEWAVDLTKRIYVPTEILDACVLSADGSATLTTTATTVTCVSEGWIKRVGKLESWREHKVAAAEELLGKLPDTFVGPDRTAVEESIVASVLGACFSEGVLSGHIDAATGDITVNLRRHGRLVEDHAKALLVLASQHQSRPDVTGELFLPSEGSGSAA